MERRPQSSDPGRWSEVLLGGMAAGMGAPLLLRGMRRMLRLGHGGSGTGMGWTAGVLGALVAGRLARRRLSREREQAEAQAPGDEAPAQVHPDAATREEHSWGFGEVRFQAPRDLEPAAQQAPSTEPEPSLEPEPSSELEADAELMDARRDARRRLSAMRARALAPVEHEVPRALMREPRRGPNGREQPWHEVMTPTPA